MIVFQYGGLDFSPDSGPETVTVTAFDLSISILLLFLPQFLLSLFSTLNFRDKSSLRILYRHPYIIILPMVTFFTFSRIKRSNEESRIMFSKKFTWFNIIVSTVGFVSWLVWYYYALELHLEYKYILTIPLPLYLSSILLTVLFLHLDKLCCCCCNPREQLSVYDPDLDKRFIMKDDVETAADDVETKTTITFQL